MKKTYPVLLCLVILNYLQGFIFSGLSIMDNTAVFYTVNMGSIPVGRTSYGIDDGLKSRTT
jgi:hypothetical protein